QYKGKILQSQEKKITFYTTIKKGKIPRTKKNILRTRDGPCCPMGAMREWLQDEECKQRVEEKIWWDYDKKNEQVSIGCSKELRKILDQAEVDGCYVGSFVRHVMMPKLRGEIASLQQVKDCTGYAPEIRIVAIRLRSKVSIINAALFANLRTSYVEQFKILHKIQIDKEGNDNELITQKQKRSRIKMNDDFEVNSDEASGDDVAQTINIETKRKYPQWIKYKKNLDSQHRQLFIIGDSGGIRCIIYNNRRKEAVKSMQIFVLNDAFPKQLFDITRHLGSKTHLRCLGIKTIKPLGLSEIKVESAAKQLIKIIYCHAKQQVANKKIPSFHAMIISLGVHELLQKFGHVSNTSITIYLQIVSNIIIRSVKQRIQRSIFWGAMVNEFTNVSNVSQFITYIRFIENGEIITLFLVIRPLGSGGQTALNQYLTFIGMTQSYYLNLAFVAGMCVDGDASIVGIKSALVTRIKTDSINNEDVIELKYAENT
ncbi:MAG: hypothetical protein EZS28_025226, partial [Streblomastix strix]